MKYNKVTIIIIVAILSLSFLLWCIYIPSSLYTLSTITYTIPYPIFFTSLISLIRDKIGIFPGLNWLFQLVSTILRPILRILAEKVRWVWFWRWDFSVKLEPCYVVLIPTLRRTLRLFFLGMVKTAFYSPGSRKSREHSRERLWIEYIAGEYDAPGFWP